jgi:hypothetical protein
MTERLHTLRDAAGVLRCATKTLENPKSTYRKALEAEGAIVRFGRFLRVKDSGLQKIAQHGAPNVAAAA